MNRNKERINVFVRQNMSDKAERKTSFHDEENDQRNGLKKETIFIIFLISLISVVCLIECSHLFL